MQGRNAEPAPVGGEVEEGPEGRAGAPGDGVDVSLVRWMLSLSPRERLLLLQSNVRSILRLRGARAKG